MGNNLDELISKGIDYLKSNFGEETVEMAINFTKKFIVEVPGWQVWKGFGGGGRFEGGTTGGAARNTEEIAQDIGFINKLTNSTPTIGLHILWFLSSDGINGDFEIAKKVKKEFESYGVRMGSISPTYFLLGSEDGSFTSQDSNTRERYIVQTLLGAKISAELSNGLLTLWFPDGTNYPGQRKLQDKIRLMKDCIIEFWNRVPNIQKEKLDKVLIEYKVFEPGTYSTTIPDWGTSAELSRLIERKGGVLVDLGHHHHSTNIEQIVAVLIALGIPGGFHFNTRYAADDDHSVQADYQLSKIFYELIQGNVIFNQNLSKNWAYALDQMARAEQRIPSILKSVDALKKSIAKAVLVNNDLLEKCQKEKDLIKANVEFEKALLYTDSSPIVMESYRRQDLHPIPLLAYYESGYQKKIEYERKK
jgi:L-rhamnose isomerase/sugar isomerase